jgi:hypothetical protein
VIDCPLIGAGGVAGYIESSRSSFSETNRSARTSGRLFHFAGNVLRLVFKQIPKFNPPVEIAPP